MTSATQTAPGKGRLRAFDPETDYPAVVACHNRANPDEPLSAAEFRYRDNYLPAGRWSGRWVWDDDNEIVAYCQARHQVGDHQPATYRLEIQVCPGRGDLGIAETLYRHLETVVVGLGARILHCWAREDNVERIQFLSRRGHVATRESRESRCDLGSFRSDKIPDLRPALEQSGVWISTISAYAAGCPDALSRWHAVSEQVGADAPSNGPYVPVPFETWIQRLQHPGYRPDAQFLAIYNDFPIGVASLWHRSADSDLDAGVTGVVREHRRRGIATALKLAAFEYARKIGAPGIRTDNAADNAGMLAINGKMGFMPMPAWVQYTRLL